VHEESLLRHQEFAAGIVRYQQYPRGEPKNPPAIFTTMGTTRVLDYGTMENAIPLLIIPSLINRYNILDLSGQRSFVRTMAERGFHPYLIDWDAPGAEESNFDLSDYIARRLEPILEKINNHHAGQRVAVLGYCMGGLLALALASRKPEQTQSLALLATPWDFHAEHEAQSCMLQSMLPQFEAMIDALGEVPVDVLQAMFTSLNPWLSIDKFRRFGRAKSDTDHDAMFVELEDWLNGGAPLTGPAARECLRDWYVENSPAKGNWQVCGKAVRPDQIQCPSIAFIPQSDHIVPPASAMALVNGADGMEHMTLSSGHIGMVVGARSRDILIDPLAKWLTDSKK
jgi:polyhydroxyalkanoate synthase